jgi:hypothetical protein
LHLLEAWIVVLGIEWIRHLAVGDVHGGVAARVSILIVDVVCLQIVSRWLLLLLLSLEPSIDILDHRLILAIIASLLVLIIFIYQLNFNSFIFTLCWLLLLLLDSSSRGISLILNEALHEILCIRLHLLQREALILNIVILLLLLLLIQGVLVLLN